MKKIYALLSITLTLVIATAVMAYFIYTLSQEKTIMASEGYFQNKVSDFIYAK